MVFCKTKKCRLLPRWQQPFSIEREQYDSVAMERENVLYFFGKMEMWEMQICYQRMLYSTAMMPGSKQL